MKNVLEVKNLSLSIFEEEILKGLSFSVKEGEFLSLVGESGSGKSVLALSIMGILPVGGIINEGEINFKSENLLLKKERELDKIRGKEIAVVLQDALTALNPVMTVLEQVMEGIIVHDKKSKKEAKKEAISILKEVGLDEKTINSYPRTLSGGQRQRALIAMALALKPLLLIADEPTTALDAIVQGQIMDLIEKMRKKMDMSVLFITHDIALASRSDRILVLKDGIIIEEMKENKNPKNDYTKKLIDASERMRLGE